MQAAFFMVSSFQGSRSTPSIALQKTTIAGGFVESSTYNLLIAFALYHASQATHSAVSVVWIVTYLIPDSASPRW